MGGARKGEKKKRKSENKRAYQYHQQQQFPTGVSREDNREAQQRIHQNDPYYESLEELKTVHFRIFSNEASLSILGK